MVELRAQRSSKPARAGTGTRSATLLLSTTDAWAVRSTCAKCGTGRDTDARPPKKASEPKPALIATRLKVDQRRLRNAKRMNEHWKNNYSTVMSSTLARSPPVDFSWIVLPVPLFNVIETSLVAQVVNAPVGLKEMLVLTPLTTS